jgi:hypothetical protein
MMEWKKTLKEVVVDYGFDGWHAADAQGPAMPVNHGYSEYLDDDFFFQFSEHIGEKRISEDGDRRCAEGAMICLGDGISEHDWRTIEGMRDLTYSFEISQAEGYAWLSDNSVFDVMRLDHERHGA